MKPEAVIALVAAHAAIATGVMALLAVTWAAAPGHARRASHEATERPVRSLLVGSGAVMAWLGLAALVARAQVKPLGLVLVLAGAGLLILGALAGAGALGARLGQGLGRPPSPLGRVAVGWATIAALAYVPVAGWIAMAVALLVGIGASVRAGLAAPPEQGFIPEREDPLGFPQGGA